MQTLFTFWLAPDSGEKLTLDVTILLSLVFYLQMVSDYIPRGHSKIPLLTLFTLTNFSLVFLSCSLTVFILRLYYKTPSLISGSSYQIPYRLRVFLFKYMARIVCLRFHFRDREQLLTHRPSNFGRDVLTASDLKAAQVKLEKLLKKKQSTSVVNETSDTKNQVNNFTKIIEPMPDKQLEPEVKVDSAFARNTTHLSALASTPSDDSLDMSLKVTDLPRSHLTRNDQLELTEAPVVSNRPPSDRVDLEDVDKQKYLGNMTRLLNNLRSLNRFIRRSIHTNQNHKFDRKGQLVQSTNSDDDSNSSEYEDEPDSEPLDIYMCDGDLVRQESAKPRPASGSRKKKRRSSEDEEFRRKMRPLTLEEKLIYYQEWKQAALILDR